MSILDAFKKKKKTGNPMDPNNMGMLQRMAMKKLEKMSPEEREKLMKKDILNTLEQMKKSGQMNDHQVFEAKKRLGLL